MKLGWADVWTGLGIALLLGLGIWQMERLAWKENLLAEIAAATSAPVLNLNSDALPPQVTFRTAQVSGRFDHTHEFQLLSRTHDGQVGRDLVTPLLLPDGRMLLIARGWVPEDKADPSTRPQSQPADTLTLQGRIMPAPRQGWMQPDNAPERNQWFFIDLRAMTLASGYSLSFPFYLQALPEAEQAELPLAKNNAAQLSNNHLQYALTWFTLAGILCLMRVYARKRS